MGCLRSQYLTPSHYSVANHYVGLRFRPDAKPQEDMLVRNE